MQACADLQQEVPTDTQVLNLLAMVLKAAGQQTELAATYAAASAAQPKNAELLRGLFAAHVACGPRAHSNSRASCLPLEQARPLLCHDKSGSCARTGCSILQSSSRWQ